MFKERNVEKGGKKNNFRLLEMETRFMIITGLSFSMAAMTSGEQPVTTILMYAIYIMMWLLSYYY